MSKYVAVEIIQGNTVVIYTVYLLFTIKNNKRYTVHILK